MLANLNEQIVNWYKSNKRNLPWRKTNDPYKIWLSEIILQQTRVQQGQAYYEKFVSNFPKIEDLAKADEQAVLQLWQGLGYYSRARNLHKAAKIIVAELNGVFPKSYTEIIQLPGVGDYTAAAISSFAYDEPQAVLDGNVFRVLSRIFNIDTPIDSTKGKKDFRLLAQEFLDKNNPAEHNQAMMEFGALQCTPKSPDCANCPIQVECEGLRAKTIHELPVKSKKTKVINRYLHYFLLNRNQTYLIEKREEKGIWQHLYQLPLIENPSEANTDFTAALLEKYGLSCTNVIAHDPVVHLLSHQKLYITFHSARIDKLHTDNKLVLLTAQNFSKFPFPKPIVEFLSNRMDNFDK